MRKCNFALESEKPCHTRKLHELKVQLNLALYSSGTKKVALLPSPSPSPSPSLYTHVLSSEALYAEATICIPITPFYSHFIVVSDGAK